MQKITTCLWFNDQAENAAKLYTSLFKNSRILSLTRYNDAAAKVSGRPKGSCMTVKFRLEGQEFVALNGGPIFKFTEAISLVVHCKTQREIDRLWARLTAGGGEESQCGWLKDKYGLSWQIVPADLDEMLSEKSRAERVMQTLWQMRKLDIKTLKRAYKG
jgi:predicted 3-demethylubiquinone-9 3-methyltransferase (glyoxalase superfamily)